MPRTRTSAGLLMCRLRSGVPEVLLVHPGSPLYANKDEGVWTLPKGLVEPDEDYLDAARREFEEETGFVVDAPRFHPLGHIRQKSGKVVHAWAFAGDGDPSRIQSNTFELEWPPRSGRLRSFPEVDRGAFFGRTDALRKILEAQRPLVERALSDECTGHLFGSPPPPA